jgi:hypothetical protein
VAARLDPHRAAASCRPCARARTRCGHCAAKTRAGRAAQARGCVAARSGQTNTIAFHADRAKAGNARSRNYPGQARWNSTTRCRGQTNATAFHANTAKTSNACTHQSSRQAWRPSAGTSKACGSSGQAPCRAARKAHCRTTAEAYRGATAKARCRATAKTCGCTRAGQAGSRA